MQERKLILNAGCGGREHDKQVWYGDHRIDCIPFRNATHLLDIHELPDDWTEKYTKVVCYTTLEHLESPIIALRNMVRVLRTHGILEIIVPNVYYWRRIYRNWTQRLDCLNKSDPSKLPDHKQAWDIIEMNNTIRQLGLDFVSVEYLDWQPEWRRRTGSIFGKVLDRILPPMFNTIETKFVLKKVNYDERKTRMD